MRITIFSSLFFLTVSHVAQADIFDLSQGNVLAANEAAAKVAPPSCYYHYDAPTKSCAVEYPTPIGGFLQAPLFLTINEQQCAQAASLQCGG